MLFNSLAFAAFLPVVFATYWLIARRGLRLQNLFLLGASYVFYGWWDTRFLLLIVASSAVDYAVGRSLAAATRTRVRRGLLGISLAANLGLLGAFKYHDFFVSSLADALAQVGIQLPDLTLSLVLPVGISFYTFQTLSYTIDVYRRQLEPTDDPIAFFAFVSFFPQLVAGPIERARDLLPQFAAPRRFDLAQAKDGARQALWGLFKKTVIADNVAPLVEAAFSGHASVDAATLVAGVVLFAMQIYCDFSGYSDIAIGVARLFGFSLTRNFAFPYFARGVPEFWKRWHISLSSWFRDYVYIPLGGSRCSRRRWLGNVLLTFGVSGFWHGANWTFIAWGLLHGLLFLPSMLRSNGRARSRAAMHDDGPRLRDLPSIALTFALVCVGWVLFRADSLTHAFEYLARAVSPSAWTVLAPDSRYTFALAHCAVMILVEWCGRRRQHALDVVSLPVVIRWAIYLAVGNAIVFLASFQASDFIYFQF